MQSFLHLFHRILQALPTVCLCICSYQLVDEASLLMVMLGYVYKNSRESLGSFHSLFVVVVVVIVSPVWFYPRFLGHLWFLVFHKGVSKDPLSSFMDLNLYL